MTSRSYARREARTLAETIAAPIDADLGKLREIRARELAVRFGFGFAISVIAGIVTLVAGNHVGGLFLAFPAILPASLTLIGAKEGDDQAKLDAAGAAIGGIGMIGFAFTAWLLFGVIHPVAAEAAALACWLATAVGVYLLVRRLLR